MKTLNETFKREGWEYTLLKCNEFAALYSMTKTGNYYEYEVWKLRTHKKDNAFTGVKACDIKLPSTNDWGHYGWSYSRLDLAEQKFAQLTNEMTKTKQVE